MKPLRCLPLLTLMLGACAAPAADLILHRVSVVDVESGRTLPPQDVEVRAGRITRIAPAASRAPSAARVVDGAGLYLIPGLWDFHCHALKEDRWERTRRLLLAHGVTAFRDPATTRPLEEIGRLRADVAAGRVLAPRFVTSGPLLDGTPPIFDEFLTVATPEEARAAVARLHAAGADFIKVYTRLSRECFLAVLDEAARRGLPVAGHVPLASSAAEAAELGMRFIEHSFRHRMDACSAAEEIRGLLREQVEAEAAGDWQRRFQLEELTFRLGVETYDAVRTAELGRIFARHDVAFTPTLTESFARYRPELLADSTAPLLALFDDPRLEWVAPRQARTWLAALAQERGWQWGWLDAAGAGPEPLRAAWAAEHANRLRMVGDLHRAGATILAGTDVSPNFELLVHGPSLHDELGLLVRAGLTPLDALRAATLLPARALGLEGTLGSVAVGKEADLVLLEADPLADVANVARIRAVVVRGRLLTRAELDALLAEVRELARVE